MNMKIATLALAFSGVVGATGAYAGVAASPAVLVQKVDLESDPTGAGAGTLYLTFNTAPFSTKCSTNGEYWQVAGDADSIKAIQTIALSAKLSGKTVKALWNNSYQGSASCGGGGTAGYPVLRGLEIQ